MLSRRAALLLAAGMAVMVLALAGTAWAADGIAPEVGGTVPADGATGVALDAKIKVKFSEAMKDRSINPTNIYLEVGGAGCSTCVATTTIVPAKVDYVDEKTPVRAVLKPLEPLEPNTEYTVVVEGTGDGYMKAVKDASGSALASDFTFSFTTGSGTPPCQTC